MGDYSGKSRLRSYLDPGVVGLSTAIRALEAGFDVTIFAEIFPADKKSIKYTSCWAGADHISATTSNALQHRLERETFTVFSESLKKDPLIPIMMCPHTEYAEALHPDDDQKRRDYHSKYYPKYRDLEPSELPEGVVRGASFSTFHVDVPRYLPYLMDRFLSLGGRAFRVTLPSLSVLLSEETRPALTAFPSTSVSTPPTFEPAVVINCTGIGALSIGDVLDSNIYPTRGEVLIIRAPWVDHGSTYYYKDGHTSYIIPRQSGDVVLGGTFQADDWHPNSRPETVKLIKERGLKAYPELLPAHKRDTGGVADLDVVEECVGLRPTRKGGVRLEIEHLSLANKTIPIVHNYGHGGAGYQSSWGSANLAVELLQSAVNA
ncbi:FAD dependent oxidoreductase [Mycena metata]|uniref:FAD dependent oxidoreductase n=1 Tax=Mycena metata TaxID=1033252 RepID=A0AAD7NXI0_9AGAR|nr:FAD dependent oxidoreductase [Mycena metata]